MRTTFGSALALLVFAAVILALPVNVSRAADTGTTYFFVSDLHLGMGERVPGKWANQEDFRWDVEFGAFLQNLDSTTGSNAELVFLGDTFELWQSPFQTCTSQGVRFACAATDCVVAAADRNHGCTEEQALRRLKFVLEQHKPTVQRLCEFARKGANRVVIVPGNHDGALMLPSLADEVTRQCAPAVPRLTVAKDGYWVSTDKRIYADHGHVFDKVNSFPGWPQPWDTVQGKRIMKRPWGESMVQQFYNQYEELLPIIDNISGGEADGARLGIDALGKAYAVEASRRFLGFLAFDISLKQKLDFLGEQGGDNVDDTLGGAADAGPQWNVPAIRATTASKFYVESMPFGDLRSAAESALPPMQWSDVADEDILELCDQRKILTEYYGRMKQLVPAGKSIELCPLVAGASAESLGYVADKVLGLDLRNRRKHIQNMATQLGRQFDVYVYGHTHAAVEPAPQKVTSLWQVSVTNTGAFQRLATIQELRDLAGKMQKPVGQVFAQLTPDQLPPCYSFVRVKPYAANKPAAELLWWTQAGGKWSEGACGAFPQ